MINAVDKKFMGFAEEFLELVLKERAPQRREDLVKVVSRAPFPVTPVVIRDYLNLGEADVDAIKTSYQSLGIAHLVVCNPDETRSSNHPLFSICDQLREVLDLRYPLTHPLETHPKVIERFGRHDSTVKIYDLPKPVGGPSYREVAESSDRFEVHFDGLSSGGTVQTIVLYMDSAPLFGGFTFFYDMFSLGVALAEEDMEAFRHLFVPDAFTALRPRGKGAIKVISPVFYINDFGLPQVFYRKDSGEYTMTWREDCAPLARARQFLAKHTEPFSLGSFFVPFTRRGSACISRNRDIAHGRTAFLDGVTPEQCRVLSRKWFVTEQHHSEYKHVPGISIRADIAALRPEQFGEGSLSGDWLYDFDSDENVRVK